MGRKEEYKMMGIDMIGDQEKEVMGDAQGKA